MSTPDTKIKPEDINTTRHFFNGFGHRETEISANWIVRFCQKRGEGWKPFMLSELEKFYTPGDGFWFNRLTTEKWVSVKDGVVTLTVRFVERCHKASPVQS